jgi:hypothetical protein
MRGIRLACLSGAFALLAIPGCGGGGNNGDDDGDDDSSTPDADIPEGFSELIGRNWTIPPGEVYRCVGIRVDRDYWISEFHTPNPTGEHHAVVTVADDPGGFGGTQLGEYNCGVNTLGLEMMFASGVGTDNLALPEGTAIKVEAGQFVHLNLHLFNTTNGDIEARSQIMVKEVAPVTPDKEVEMVFAGTFDIDVQPQQSGTASGGCTFQQASTIFAYWPHMHQAANHQKVTLTQGGNTRTIHDEEFDFNDQINYPLDPMIQISPGDSINVECTYYNESTTDPIEFGDSSNEEMCFTGLYRYPKQAFTLFDCAEGQF